MFNVLYDRDSQTTCRGTLIEHDLMSVVRQGWNRRMIRQEVRLLACYTEYIGSYLLTFRDNLSGPTFKGLLNYQSTPRNIPEERRSHLHRNGSLKSHKTKLNMRIKIFKKEKLLNMVLIHTRLQKVKKYSEGWIRDSLS